MRLGPNDIYKCPNCEFLILSISFISFNNFGASSYSDGQVIAPMLPNIPNLTKCKRCNAIFWLNKLEVFSYEFWEEFNNPLAILLNPTNYKEDEACWAEHLEIDEYFEALEKNIFENKEEEIYIRKRIWWLYNDRLKMGQKIFNGEEDELQWKENLNKLLNLLDVSDIDQRIMAAEIYRNFGEFEKCINLIESIDDVKLDRLKKIYINECNLKNRWLILLNKDKNEK